MRYFLDTEFNGWGGALISVALVPEHGDQEYYAVIDMADPLHPWVERNVMPYLRAVPPGLDDGPVTRPQAAASVAAYLAHDDAPLIVADWPDDIAYFCALLVTGEGDMAPVGPLKFELIRCPGFSTAAISAVPHNALHDARALRGFVERWQG